MCVSPDRPEVDEVLSWMIQSMSTKPWTPSAYMQTYTAWYNLESADRAQLADWLTSNAAILKRIISNNEFLDLRGYRSILGLLESVLRRANFFPRVVGTMNPNDTAPFCQQRFLLYVAVCRRHGLPVMKQVYHCLRDSWE